MPNKEIKHKLSCSKAKCLSILAELHDSEIEVGRYSSSKICSSHEKTVKPGPSTVPVPKPKQRLCFVGSLWVPLQDLLAACSE